MVLRTEQIDNVSCVISYDTCSPEAVSDAKKIFQQFQATGVIGPGAFEDDEWLLNNEIHSSRFRFYTDEDAYQSGAGVWTGCSMSEYFLTVRTFTALQLGQVSLEHLTATANEMRRIANSLASNLDSMDISLDASCVLSFLPGESDDRDTVLEELDFIHFSKRSETSSKRQLGNISLYLIFGEKTDRFWLQGKPSEKIRWFPVWLWYRITFILPLRPTEFTLIPWDCIGGTEGERTLTVCRTRLKKRKGGITYLIERDYETTVHTIPNDLAEAILWYKDHSTPGARSERLLGNGKWYSYTRLGQDLRDFCTDCIDFPEAASQLLPGASRHLSLIGLRASGADARVAVQAARHNSFLQSIWYSSNISDLMTGDILHYIRASGSSRSLRAPFRLPPGDAALHTVPGGKCDAAEVFSGDVTECMRYTTSERHAGECPGCPHFYPDRDSLFIMTESCPELNRSDSSFLISMVDCLRSENGAKKTIDEMLDSMQVRGEKYLEALIKKENTRHGQG